MISSIQNVLKHYFCDEKSHDDYNAKLYIKGNDTLDDYINVKQLTEYFCLEHEASEDENFSVEIEDFSTTDVYTVFFIIGRMTRTLPSKNILNASKVQNHLDKLNCMEACIKHSDSFPEKTIQDFMSFMNDDLGESVFFGDFDDITIADYCMFFFVAKINDNMEIEKFTNLQSHYKNVKFLLEYNGSEKEEYPLEQDDTHETTTNIETNCKKTS